MKLSRRYFNLVRIKDIVILILRSLLPLLLFAALSGPGLMVKFPDPEQYIFIIDQSRRFMEGLSSNQLKGKRYLWYDGRFSIKSSPPPDTIDFVYPVDKAFLYLDTLGLKGAFFSDLHAITMERLIKMRKYLKNRPWIVPLNNKNKKQVFIKKVWMNMAPVLKDSRIHISLFSTGKSKAVIKIKGAIDYVEKLRLRKGDNLIEPAINNLKSGLCSLYIDNRPEFFFYIPSLKRKVYLYGDYMNFVEEGLKVIPGVVIKKGLGYDGIQFISTSMPETLKLHGRNVVFITGERSQGYYRIKEAKGDFLKKYVEGTDAKFFICGEEKGEVLISLSGGKPLLTKKSGNLYLALPLHPLFTDLVYKKDFIPFLFYLVYADRFERLPLYHYAGDTVVLEIDKEEILFDDGKVRKFLKGRKKGDKFIYNITSLKAGIIKADTFLIPFNYTPEMYEDRYMRARDLEKKYFFVGEGSKNISSFLLWSSLILIIAEILLLFV